MPYFAPEAAIPITSCAPRFADKKASPATQAGIERPAVRKLGARPHETLQHEADSEDKAEVNDHHEIIDPLKFL